MLLSAGMLLSKCCHAIIVYDGNKYQCGACTKHCESAGTVGDHAAVEAEFARLEREVIERCSAYCKGVLEVEQHGYPEDVSVNEWHSQHCDRQTAMIDAYKALIDHKQR